MYDQTFWRSKITENIVQIHNINVETGMAFTNSGRTKRKLNTYSDK